MAVDHKKHSLSIVERATVSKEVTGLDEDGVPVTGGVENIDWDDEPRIFCETCQEYVSSKDIGASSKWELFY